MTIGLEYIRKILGVRYGLNTSIMMRLKTKTKPKSKAK